MKNHNALIDELIDLLRQELGQYQLPIGENTEIALDLGVAGDDGEDLVIAIQRRFQVDISRFNTGQYFGSEPTFWGSRRESLKSLTVKALLEQINRGYLE